MRQEKAELIFRLSWKSSNYTISHTEEICFSVSARELKRAESLVSAHITPGMGSFHPYGLEI